MPSVVTDSLPRLIPRLQPHAEQGVDQVRYERWCVAGGSRAGLLSGPPIDGADGLGCVEVVREPITHQIEHWFRRRSGLARDSSPP